MHENSYNLSISGYPPDPDTILQCEISYGIVIPVASNRVGIVSDFVQSSQIHIDARLRKQRSLTERQQRIMLLFIIISAIVIVAPQSTVTIGNIPAIKVAQTAASFPEKITAPVGQKTLSPKSALMVGDKIKIELFQKNLGSDAQGASVSNTKGASAWALRPELSGVFAVQEDGAVVLPILGAFEALNRGVSDVSADVVAGFRATFATEARAAVTIAERPPIYVVGAVKSPGSYRYEAGLTALHAIALSGGLERGPSDQWSSIEVAREGAKAASAAQVLKVASAELAILRAEGDGTDVIVPEELVALLGSDAAQIAINQARDRRRKRLEALVRQRSTLQLGIDIAEKNLAVDSQRLTVLSTGASARTQRVDILQGFVTKGMSSQALLNQAQAELSDSNDRALNAKSMMGDAEYKVSMAHQELTKFDLDRLIERETAITALEKEVAEAQANLKVYKSIKEHLAPQLNGASRSGTQTIEIVRKHPSPTVLSPADPTVTLVPGDLVRIVETLPSKTN